LTGLAGSLLATARLLFTLDTLLAALLVAGADELITADAVVAVLVVTTLLLLVVGGESSGPPPPHPLSISVSKPVKTRALLQFLLKPTIIY